MGLPYGERTVRYLEVLDSRRKADDDSRRERIEIPRPGLIEVTREEQFAVFDGHVWDGEHFSESSEWYCVIGKVPEDVDRVKLFRYNMIYAGRIETSRNGEMRLCLRDYEDAITANYYENAPDLSIPFSIADPTSLILEDGRVFFNCSPEDTLEFALDLNIDIKW